MTKAIWEWGWESPWNRAAAFHKGHCRTLGQALARLPWPRLASDSITIPVMLRIVAWLAASRWRKTNGSSCIAVGGRGKMFERDHGRPRLGDDGKEAKGNNDEDGQQDCDPAKGSSPVITTGCSTGATFQRPVLIAATAVGGLPAHSLGSQRVHSRRSLYSDPQEA